MTVLIEAVTWALAAAAVILIVGGAILILVAAIKWMAER